MNRRSAKRPRFSVGGQPVFENEDSSNHSGLGVVDYDDNSLSQQPETSTNSFDQHHFPQHQFRLLSRKDKEGFFQYPVTDQVKLFKSNFDLSL
jgi:hypothetical protein